MAPRRRRRPAGQDKAPQRRQTLVEAVDGLFQPLGLLRLDAQRLAGRLVGQRRQAQVRAHVEQVVLKDA